MLRNALVCSWLVLNGCFWDGFTKETAKQTDLHQGGSIMLTKCGYSVTTQDGASIPEFGTDQLGDDPTPKFIHLNVANDPKQGLAVLWRTNDETTLATTVQYGVNGATDQSEKGFTFVYDVATGGDVRMHETHLCGLTPNTTYTYRVGGKGADGTEVWSPNYTFTTAPDRSATPDAQVTMLVIGDTRDGYSTWGATLKTAFQKAVPDVILFSGDGTTLGPIQDEWDAWFMAADPLLASTPMMLAHGNHDVNSVNWFSQFAQPGDEQNFGLDYGPVHLTVANDTPMDPADVAGVLATTLDNNLKAGSHAPWNLLMHHKPMWTAAAGPHPEDALTTRVPWQPLVDADNVDMVFNGHDHDYERTKPMRGSTPGVNPSDGTIYTVVGSAGAELYDNGSSFWTATSAKTFCFAIVRVRQGMLQYDAYKNDGSALDTLTITK